MTLSNISTHYLDMSLLKNGCNIIDAGSSHGAFISEFVEACSDNEIEDYNVFAIECSRKNMKILEPLGSDKISINNMALSGQNEEIGRSSSRERLTRVV